MAPFPGFEHIYALEDPFSSSFRGEFKVPLDDVVPIVRGELRPKEPVVIAHAMGRKQPSDVIWTTVVDPLIVRARVVDLLSRDSLTGWTTYPVQVLGADGSPIDGYAGLAISGRCGAIDYSQSQIVLVDYPDGHVPKYKGVYFDPSSWDGSDLFMSSGEQTWIFATERLRGAFDAAKIRNIGFERTSDAVLELLAEDFEPDDPASG